ncbi:MAG: hypothetical protein H6Q79_3106 [Deltaproteobacteria bacterium]|nr:hypothetical protein [Deltaproteobacteria bacterium]
MNRPSSHHRQRRSNERVPASWAVYDAKFPMCSDAAPAVGPPSSASSATTYPSSDFRRFPLTAPRDAESDSLAAGRSLSRAAAYAISWWRYGSRGESGNAPSSRSNDSPASVRFPSRAAASPPKYTT